MIKLKDELTFGKFLLQKRKEKEVTARQIAKALKVSAVYICDLEKDRRGPPKKEHMEKIIEILDLNKQDKAMMLDLAARSRNTISADLPDYIMEKDIVRVALRAAMENGADEREWQQFIDRIQRKD